MNDTGNGEPAGEAPTGEAPTDETSTAGARLGSSLVDAVSHVLLLGLGAASITADRAQAILDDLVHRGQMTSDEARETFANLAARSRSEARSTARSLESTLHGTYRDVGLATRKEVEDLDFRIRQLEHRLGLLEREVDSSSSPEHD